MSTWIPDHEPQTWGEQRGTRMVWFSDCRCGWRSPDVPFEFDADMAGLDHDDGAGREVDDPA